MYVKFNYDNTSQTFELAYVNNYNYKTLKDIVEEIASTLCEDLYLTRTNNVYLVTDLNLNQFKDKNGIIDEDLLEKTGMHFGYLTFYNSPVLTIKGKII